MPSPPSSPTSEASSPPSKQVSSDPKQSPSPTSSKASPSPSTPPSSSKRDRKKKTVKYEDDESDTEQSEQPSPLQTRESSSPSEEPPQGRTVVGRSAVTRTKSGSASKSAPPSDSPVEKKQRITSSSTVSFTLSSLSKLHHGLMEKPGPLKVTIEVVEKDDIIIDKVVLVGDEDKARSCNSFKLESAEEEEEASKSVAKVETSESAVTVDYPISTFSEKVQTSQLGKLHLFVTVTREHKKQSVVGRFTSLPFMSLPYGSEQDLELEKEGKGLLGGKKVKDHRGLMKVKWEYNRDTKAKDEEDEEDEVGEEKEVEQTEASPKTSKPKMPSKQKLMKVMAKAMSDPEIAAAFKDPDFKDISKKIQRDLTILADPMNRLKEDLEANPKAAKVAATLLPKIQKLLEPTPPPSASSSLSPSPTPPKPMWANQNDLPRLPLPSIYSTVELFLEVAETLVSPETFKKTKVKAEAFKSLAVPLQKKLEKVDRNSPDSSWFASFHHDMYMNARYPGFVYKNPAAVTKQTLFTSLKISGQVDIAAHVACATIVFAKKIFDETLEPETFKGIVPLDMLQFPRMFGCTRLPGEKRDTMLPAPDTPPSHIVVIRGDSFYKLDLQDMSNVNFDKVKEALLSITESDEPAPNPPIGALTCTDRTSWAKNRTSLIELDSLNAESLKTIDTSLFVLCLDPNPTSTLEDAMKAAVHGNPRHRWFDKPCTLIVTSDGRLCSNCEHSWGDGIAMMRWGQEIVKEISKPSYTPSSPPDYSYVTTPIAFRLDKALQNKVTEAGTSAELLAQSTRRSIFTHNDFGAAFLKQNKLSPDATMQQVLQLAYMKRHGSPPNHLVSSYCVAQHMAFKAGRNERMRSSTTSSHSFIKSVINQESPKIQYQQLKAATERHSTLTRMCTMGAGFDRHLYALCQVATDGDGDLPALFSDEAFTTLMTDTLCSSMLPGEFVEVMMASPAFGDFNDGGDDDDDEGQSKLGKYFVPYSTFDDRVTFFVNGFEPEDMDKFKDAIAESIEEVKRIIVKGSMETEFADSATSEPVEPPTTASKSKTKKGPDMTLVMAKAMKDPEISKAFANPKYQVLTQKIMADPSILLNPMERLKADLEENPEWMSLAKSLFPKLSKLMRSSPAPSPTPSSNSSKGSVPSLEDDSDKEEDADAATPTPHKKQSANTFSPTNSESSASIIESQQTVAKKKKKKMRRVPRKVNDNDKENAADLRSETSSPAFSDKFIEDKVLESMEEEITRAIALASKNKDMAELTLMTALFGEGSESEVRAASPEAKKYLAMVAERDAAKNLVASKLQNTAASPQRRAKAQHSTGKNADGTPFSKAQIASMKRCRAAKEGGLIPPQAAVYIQLIWRGKSARKLMRRRHRSATLIVATFRGFLVRRNTKVEMNRWRNVLKDEKKRITRVQRIENQRAELALLRRTPASRLSDVDSRRRNIAVRRIQRFFRTLSKRPWYRLKHGRKHKKTVAKSIVGDTISKNISDILDPAEDLTVDIEEQEGAIDESQASFWSRASVQKSSALDTTDTSMQAFENDAYDTPNMKEIKTRLQIRQRTIPNYGTGVQATALRLADLQRRVAQSSYESRREKELKEREEALKHAGKNSRGGARRGYEKLFELQKQSQTLLANRSLVEEEAKKASERRNRRLQRFDRLANLLTSPPGLGDVAKEYKLRNENRPNQLKEMLAGWKLPRSEKSWRNAKKAHKATINALKAREEWWSLNLGEKFGGGTYDLRETASFEIDEDRPVGDGPVVGKYDADEASLFWYKYSGGQDEQLENFLTRRSKLTHEEKLNELDREIEEAERRKKSLALNVSKVIAREQRKLAAPGELDSLLGGRERRVYTSATLIQRCIRGTLARRRVARQISNVRVAGALQMLVQELGGNKGTADAAGALGTVLGSILQGQHGGGGAALPRPPLYQANNLAKKESPEEAKNNDANNTPSLFYSDTKRTTRGRGERKSDDTPVSSIYSASTPTRGALNSNPSSPAVNSTINQYGASGSPGGLRVQTRGAADGLMAPTPLITGMLVDVDMGLGAAHKPKVWTPAKILSINPAGDVTVEFDSDGQTMNGVIQDRIRIRGGLATPSTALLERRLSGAGSSTEDLKDSASTPMEESKGIFTPNTITLDAMNNTQSTVNTGRTLSRGNSYRSMTDSLAQKQMLDDSAVLEALANSDLATAAMSPGKRTNDTDDSFSLVGTAFDDENKSNAANRVDIPRLNITGEGQDLGKTMDSGYISPPSSSPVKSSLSSPGSKKGRQVLQKIIDQLVSMKKERGGGNTSSFAVNFNSAREFESSGRVRSVMGMMVDAVSKVGGITSYDHPGKARAMSSIFETLDLNNNGMIGVDDVVNVVECLDATLNLNLSALCDVRSAALSLGSWLKKGDGSVNLKELGQLVYDCARGGGSDARSVFLYLGRLLSLGGGKIGKSGKEFLAKIFGEGVKVCSVDEFKKGLSSLKPKLSGGEVDSLFEGLKLGDGNESNLVNLERFVEMCFPLADAEDTGSGEGTQKQHRDLQKLLKRHFDADGRMLNNFLLLCGDVDHGSSGYLDWKIFLRVLDNSTLLLTSAQALLLCLLLTRDGGVKLMYQEMSRISRGEILTMPQGSMKVAASPAVDVKASITKGTPNSLRELRKKATPTSSSGGRPKRLLGSKKKGGSGAENFDSQTPTALIGGSKTQPVGSRSLVRQSSSKKSLSVTFKERSPER